MKFLVLFLHPCFRPRWVSALDRWLLARKESL